MYERGLTCKRIILYNFVCNFYSKMCKRVNIHAHESQLGLEKVDSGVLLDLFPFALILDHDMKIRGSGDKVLQSWYTNKRIVQRAPFEHCDKSQIIF